MAEVARRAGVGMATLYRNFPGRRDLLEALYTGRVDEICAAAAAGPDGGDTRPGPGLTTWLGRFAEFVSAKHTLAAELLTHTDAGDPVFGGSRDRVLAAGRPLLAAAQAAGEARGDLTVEQVLDLVVAVMTISSDPDHVAPILATALDGLRSTRG